MKGKSEIPDLRLERVQKLIESFVSPPNLIFMKMFGSMVADSDTIKWESMSGSRGMTPFAAPGAPAQTTVPGGKADHQAFAAYWKEKMYFDEVFLNNLKQPGTTATYLSAKQRLAREFLNLRNRCDRRKEWMFAQMLSAGSFSYKAPTGVEVSVNYDVPSDQLVTLADSRKWDSGSQRNIVEDIMDAQIFMGDTVGAKLDYAFITSDILKLMILDKSIQTLMAKSSFGDGDLFTRPAQVLKSLLNIDNLVVYDEQYQVTGWLTAAVTGSSTSTIYVDDASDFVVGGTLRFEDVSAGTHEDETITAVDVNAGTITVASAPTASFKAGEDRVTMTKKFLPKDKFTMFASSVEGQPIAEFMEAPFGLGRNYGIFTDSKEEWDPDGIWIRIQNKGLPVLYRRDALYVLTVK